MSAPGAFRGTPKGRTQQQPYQTDSPSNIPVPRPRLEPTASHVSDAGASNLSAARSKQSKRDEAIRRKIETDLSKKKSNPARARQARKAQPGTVMSLRPSPALQIKPSTTVAEAAQLMAAKREDCVLVTDDDDRIAGIFTAKDLAFRVVGEGLKANQVTIEQIMTKNPLCAKTDTSATDALDLMVRKGFRHLPVMDENHDISGILDITKCFYDAMEKLERAYSSSRKLYDALEGVQAELGSSQPQQIIQYVEAIRNKMSGPTLESVLNGLPPTTVSVRTSVKEAAALMKSNHTTAVLVQDQGSITGIFTSKDVVLRVIAAGLDPSACSVVRVMTPHPDFAPMDMSIQAALRKMHDGHYLNLPVMGAEGDIVGMVDVLKLTYATLDQINTMSTGDGEGPAWNKFWMSLDHETESMMSGEGGSRLAHTADDLASPTHGRPGMDRLDSVAPGDSASHNGFDSPEPQKANLVISFDSTPFPFKFKSPNGRMHRLKVIPSSGLEELVTVVAEKLGSETDQLGGTPKFEDGKLSGLGFALSYLDNEGDTVSITTDGDLLEAATLAANGGRDKVDLFVHHPDQPPLPATMAPQGQTNNLPTPPASIRERRVSDDTSEQEDEVSERVTQRKERKTSSLGGAADQAAKSSGTAMEKKTDIIAGVPNELLLPGAIVTLAVVIIGVFTVTRSSSR